MKKTAMVVLVFAVMLSFLTGCGLIPIPKEGLKTGETLVVDIESYAFYEKLTITEMEDGKTKFEIDRSSPLRSDDFAREIMETFKNRLSVRLRESGVVVTPGAPIKVKVSLGCGVRVASIDFVAFVGHALFSKQEVLISEISALTGYPDPARSLFEPTGSRNLRSAKVVVERLSESLSNALIALLREKGEIRSEKK